MTYRTLTVHIDDHINEKELHLISPPMEIDEIWDTGDEVLETLAEIDIFKGAKKWSDLLPWQYEVLVSVAARDYCNMNYEDTENLDLEELNEIKSIRLYTSLWAHCLHLSSGFEIGFMHIHRIKDETFIFDINATSKIDYTETEEKNEEDKSSEKVKSINHLRLVVDNDKTEDSD